MSTTTRHQNASWEPLPGRLREQLKSWLPWIVLLCAVGAGASWVTRHIIWPGYTNPQSRIYESRWGYAAAVRRRQGAFPVVTSHAEMRTLNEHFVGEGFVRSTPVLVPVVPTSRIAHIYVREGDKVQQGQILAELEKTKAELRLESARIMLQVAQAELERTRIGSSYLLATERPEKEKVRFDAAQAELSGSPKPLFVKPHWL